MKVSAVSPAPCTTLFLQQLDVVEWRASLQAADEREGERAGRE